MKTMVAELELDVLVLRSSRIAAAASSRDNSMASSSLISFAGCWTRSPKDCVYNSLEMYGHSQMGLPTLLHTGQLPRLARTSIAAISSRSSPMATASSSSCRSAALF